MKYDIVHRIRLAFPAPVWEHHCELRLAPRADTHQLVHDLELSVEPATPLRPHRDGFGNPVHAFDLLVPHEDVAVRLRARVETTLENPFDFPIVPPAAERAWIADALRDQPRLSDFVRHRSAATPDLAGLELDAPRRDPARALLEALQAVLDWTGERLELTPGFDDAPPPLAEALRAGAGTCQQLAHLLIAVARSWGAPARYVMGYCDPSYQEDAEQTLHAWTEVLVPGAGWRGLDPCTGLVTNDTYVAVAVGRDAADCPPVRSVCKGIADAAESTATLEVSRDQ